MHTITLDYIKKILGKLGYEAQYQKETNQLYLTLKTDQVEFPVFVRIYEGDTLLQILAFLPSPLDQDRIGDIGRLLHLMNKELDVPGFGMDEMAGILFFRAMVQIPNKKIDENLISTYMNVIQVICKSFFPTIQAVASGAISYEELLKKAQTE